MKRFNKKSKMNFLTVFLFLDVLLVFTLIRTSSASYVSKSIGTAEMNVALYAFSYDGIREDGTSEQIIEFNLGDIKPGDTKIFKFSVSNKDENDKVSDTSLRYSLKLITTNNLGLQYVLKKNNVVINSTNAISSDRYDTYFRYFAYPIVCMNYNSEIIDNYTLEVTLPNSYKNSKYQDMIESIKLQLVSEQMDSNHTCNGG